MRPASWEKVDHVLKVHRSLNLENIDPSVSSPNRHQPRQRHCGGRLVRLERNKGLLWASMV